MRNLNANKRSFTMGDEPKGKGWGLNPETVAQIKAWTNELVFPIEKRVSKVESDVTAINITLAKVESRLNSLDFKTQNIIDDMKKQNFDLSQSVLQVKDDVTGIKNVISRMEKEVQLNSNGLVKLNDNTTLTANDLKTAREDLSHLELELDNRFKSLDQKNKDLTLNVEIMSKEVARHPVLLEEFKRESLKAQVEMSNKMSEFSNDLTSTRVQVGDSLNKYNNLSKDFSNHLEDFNSQVKSVEKVKGDFNEFVNTHKQIHSKQDADFHNEVLRLDKVEADFNNHIVDYRLHKKPSEIRKEQAYSQLKKKVPLVRNLFTRK